MPRLAAAGALALLLGWAAAHGLSLQWWTLVPWGLAAVALGYRANRATAVVAGALYGFVLCFVFTLATWRGGTGDHSGAVLHGSGSRRCLVRFAACTTRGVPHARETRGR